MVESLSLVGAALLNFCGMAWLALAKGPHWEQSRGRPRPARVSSRALHRLAALALAASLVLCLAADHPSMASLVWVMLLTASGLAVAFTLAWRPRWLGWLTGWMA
jgi:hypothetical protein